MDEDAAGLPAREALRPVRGVASRRPRLGRLLKRDFEREMLAEDEGALAQLSQHPRFGRHDDEFRTRGQKGEEQ